MCARDAIFLSRGTLHSLVIAPFEWWYGCVHSTVGVWSHDCVACSVVCVYACTRVRRRLAHKCARVWAHTRAAMRLGQQPACQAMERRRFPPPPPSPRRSGRWSAPWSSRSSGRGGSCWGWPAFLARVDRDTSGTGRPFQADPGSMSGIAVCAAHMSVFLVVQIAGSGIAPQILRHCLAYTADPAQYELHKAFGSKETSGELHGFRCKRGTSTGDYNMLHRGAPEIVGVVGIRRVQNPHPLNNDSATQELPKTCRLALKFPLGFLDSPAAAFALFGGLRGSAAAAHWCASQFHQKLLPEIAKCIHGFWDSEAEMPEELLYRGSHVGSLTKLLRENLERLDRDLIAGPHGFGGCDAAVAVLVGENLVVAAVGQAGAPVQEPADRGVLVSERGLEAAGWRKKLSPRGPPSTNAALPTPQDCVALIAVGMPRCTPRTSFLVAPRPRLGQKQTQSSARAGCGDASLRRCGAHRRAAEAWRGPVARHRASRSRVAARLPQRELARLGHPAPRLPSVRPSVRPHPPIRPPAHQPTHGHRNCLVSHMGM